MPKIVTHWQPRAKRVRCTSREHLERWEASAKKTGADREYLGIWSTKEEALQKAQHFADTGKRPEPKRPGAPGGKGVKLTTFVPYVHRFCYKKGKTGPDRWVANVRGPDDERIYLSSCPTKAEAEAVVDHYLRTGEKPARKNPGPKSGFVRINGGISRKPEDIAAREAALKEEHKQAQSRFLAKQARAASPRIPKPRTPRPPVVRQPRPVVAKVQAPAPSTPSSRPALSKAERLEMIRRIAGRVYA